MAAARIRAGIGGAVLVLASASTFSCGSRTSMEACAGAWQSCAGSGGSGADSSGGAAMGGKAAPSSGGASGGAPPLNASGGAVPLRGGAPAIEPPTSGGFVTSGGAPSLTEPPTVLLVLDTSTSMFDRQVWTPTYAALTEPGGPLQEFQARVRFGFVSYWGTLRTSEDDLACAEVRTVPAALGNHDPIRDAYLSLGELPRRPPRETPTGHALTRVVKTLLGEPGSRKSIILISDGVPDTCATTNPSCGQDRAVSALQIAARAGIFTYPIGIGFGNEYPGCSPETAVCGRDHFQDLANAGRGLPVAAPPAGYRMLPCIANETGGELLAHYSPMGGGAPFFWTASPVEVAGAVRAIVQEILARRDF